MCVQVVAELRAAIAKHGGMSADAVGAYIKEMEAKGRLVKELWS